MVPPEFRLTLGEGGTPLEWAPELARAVGLEALWLKREDRNPTGSHKDRGVAFQIAAARAAAAAAGGTLARIALSSSGNAAISAAAYGREASIEVVAFVAPDTPEAKLAVLRRLGAILIPSPHAVTLCQAWCVARGVPNLRPSTDPNAVEGFQTLGWEIAADLAALDAARRPAADAVFTFVSSATSLVGIGRAFARAESVVGAAVTPALHAVQGAAAAAVAGPLDARPRPALLPGPAADAPTPAGRLGALGARKTRRLGEAHRLIVASGGGGWVVTDAEAAAADALLRRAGINASIEGAASLAAAARAAGEGGVRRAVVILTGAERPASAADRSTEAAAAAAASARSGAALTIDDVDAIVADRATARVP